MPRVSKLSYVEDSAQYFECIRDLSWPVFLASGSQYLPTARYDVIAADPYVSITTRGDVSEVVERRRRYLSARDPLKIVRDYLRPVDASLLGLPFSGGALGYVGYDFARRYERVGSNAVADIRIPELAMGIYDWALVVDHLKKSAWLVGRGRDASTFANWSSLFARFSAPDPLQKDSSFQVAAAVVSNLPGPRYKRAFVQVKDYIRSGDCYQINLTQRFSAPARGDAWSAYKKLRALSPAPYCAFLDYPFAQVSSSSPEQFVQVRNGHAQTKPIKGTRPRGADKDQDAAYVRELSASAKDRAENVMIVDLLRNDFGRQCESGTVHVRKLFDVETFANVHHLVSTVEGTIKPGKDAIDLFIACFPGGSITGAPKIRSMQIIDELEPHRRSIYCGAIGYFGFDGAMDTSIVIRTLLFTAGQIYAWAGGGIVADSEVESEYQESLDKAAAMLEVLASASQS